MSDATVAAGGMPRAETRREPRPPRGSVASAHDSNLSCRPFPGAPGAYDGVVVLFNRERGFGFLRTPAIERDIFFHVSKLPGRRPLTPGQRARFEVRKTRKGLAADNVVPGRMPVSPVWLYTARASAVFLLFLHFMPSSMGMVARYFATINIVTLMFYLIDKRIAGSDVMRVPNCVLQGLALSGGSPAALLAQWLLRHKIRHRSFQLTYWAIVTLQCALILLVG